MRRLRHAQPSLWEGFLAEEVAELWEPWMREVDSLLEDDELLSAVFEAQGQGSLRRAKLRRALDHRHRFPTKITAKRERGALGTSAPRAVLPRNDLSAIHRPFLA